MIRPNGLGICIPMQEINRNGEIIQQELDLLQPDWWMNWGYRTYGASDARFIPMIWGGGWAEGPVRDALLALPGRTWLIHNEPHRPDQADLTPPEAADDVRRFMSLAWQSGIGFQAALGGCGVIDETTDGIAWMRDLFYNLRRRGLSRSSYMHFHGYRFNSVPQMRRGWEAFKRLHDEVGLGAPVVMSEFCAEDTAPANQMKIMDEAKQWIDDGKIIGAAWFASHRSISSGWPNCRLTDHPPSGEILLTELGHHWISLK